MSICDGSLWHLFDVRYEVGGYVEEYKGHVSMQVVILEVKHMIAADTCRPMQAPEQIEVNHIL